MSRTLLRVAGSSLALVGAVALGAAQKAAPIVLRSAGPKPIWLRVEAPSDDVVRLWYADSPAFARSTSLAMETAPKGRRPLRRADANGSVTLTTDRLTVRIDPRTLAATVFDARTKARLAGPFDYETRDGAKWSLTEAISPDERLLGLGEDNRNGGKLNRRGTVRELWAGQQIRSGNVTAEYPIPFMLSVGSKGRAYGAFFDDVHRLRYDLGKTAKDRIRIDAEGGAADLYVIDGPAPKAVISRYTAMTGRPSLPPLWTQGYIQSRCVFYDWSDVDGAYDGLRSRGYPVDALVIDYQWPEFLNDFVWDKRWTVNGVTPGARVKGYAAKGVNLMLYGMSPMVVEASPTHRTGLAAGVFATDGKGGTVQCGYYGGDLLDFTAPAMDAWLWPQLRPRNLEGLDSWWLDLVEPEGEPPQTVYQGGKPAEIHNQFSSLVARSFEGSLLKDHPDQRPWLLARAGSAGIQRRHVALWTGDINSDYATLQAHPGEMLNSGISGINAWTCDTGGFLTGFYKNDQFGAHARLYERWMQFSAFSPITRAHKAGTCMPYEFGPATEQGTKHYLNLRYRLLPYIYAHTVEASETGVPLVRAMAVEFPDDPGSLDAKGDQYMFGKNLLVAPVLDEGVSNRPVYFPPGRWIDWDTGVEYQGGRTWVVSAPQNRIPVAVRPGAIVPMVPEMANTAVGKWDPLTVEVYPGGASSFAMARDDGRTFEYRKGKRTTTLFTSVLRPNEESFHIRESNRLFVPKRYVLRFHLDRAPLDPKGWDPKARVLTLSVDEAGERDHAVAVRLSPTRLPARPAPLLVADRAVAGKGAVGAPTPHFFPGPVLPSVVKAVDYDNGGEGVAYHRATPSPGSPYRADDAGVSGDALAGLAKGDWARYSVNAGNGGFFDLVVHAKGEGAFRLLSADRIVASVVLKNGQATLPNVYLNPGLDSLMAFVDRAGFALGSLDFRRAASPPSVVEAAWATHTGQVVATKDGLGNVGQLAGSVTLSVPAAHDGTGRVRFRYANDGSDLTLLLSVDGAKPMAVTFPRTGRTFGDLEVAVPLVEGSNRVTLSWKSDKYDSIRLAQVEVRGP